MSDRKRPRNGTALREERIEIEADGTGKTQPDAGDVIAAAQAAANEPPTTPATSQVPEDDKPQKGRRQRNDQPKGDRRPDPKPTQRSGSKMTPEECLKRTSEKINAQLDGFFVKHRVRYQSLLAHTGWREQKVLTGEPNAILVRVKAEIASGIRFFPSISDVLFVVSKLFITVQDLHQVMEEAGQEEMPIAVEMGKAKLVKAEALLAEVTTTFAKSTTALISSVDRQLRDAVVQKIEEAAGVLRKEQQSIGNAIATKKVERRAEEARRFAQDLLG